jgi:hypothetical protein
VPEAPAAGTKPDRGLRHPEVRPAELRDAKRGVPSPIFRIPRSDLSVRASDSRFVEVCMLSSNSKARERNLLHSQPSAPATMGLAGASGLG